MKNIWRLEELGEVGEILEASRPALAADLLAQHPNWQDPDISFLTTKKAIQLIMHDKMNKWAQYHNDTLHSYKMMDYIDPFIPSFIIELPPRPMNDEFGCTSFMALISLPP